MKKINLKEVILPALTLFLICFVSAFLLAGTNSITADKILENQLAQAKEARKLTFASASEFSEEKEITLSKKSVLFSEALDSSGNKLGYVFTAENQGYGGSVKVMTAIDNSGKVLSSVVLSADDETPGLGQNATKEQFIGQFKDKTGPFAFVKSGGSGNEINGITSATITSKAVIACVNDALEAFKQLGGE